MNPSYLRMAAIVMVLSAVTARAQYGEAPSDPSPLTTTNTPVLSVSVSNEPPPAPAPATAPVTTLAPTSSVQGGVWTLGPPETPPPLPPAAAENRSTTVAPTTTAPPSTQGKPQPRGRTPDTVVP